MTVQTHIRQALGRVRDERTRVAEKAAAFDEFARRVRGIPASSTGQHPKTLQATGGGTLTTTAHVTATQRPSSSDRCRMVRSAFAETVRPCSIDDIDRAEPLSATIEEELSTDLAVALDSQTTGGFTPKTKQAVLSATLERQKELTVMKQVLARERQSLQEAADAVSEVTDWLDVGNETSLADLGFDDLRERHELLATYRTRCEDRLCERQSFLDETASRGGTVSIKQRDLVRYLYEDSSFAYPVLATMTRLHGVLEDCQRIVRDHLVRRV
ncbi:hypothetical protein C440_09968 [Haloferax mucosum ATCC BAA-1512]|uniref:DUF7260 domain-containing protein n=1 Tax=Haloferax mucosum ATCC BAA-1512 TaxID=662479 RepID=M0ICN2_9EURY|nr:hypothetical protein [Haloferax mucosum]ELZ94496.1 hypothetical protein C440_09968 [Haloferax mucosum ATCC BAA-1512]